MKNPKITEIRAKLKKPEEVEPLAKAHAIS
jgi:hypothetical protein